MTSRLHIVPVGISLLNRLEGKPKGSGGRGIGHPVLRGVLGNRDVWRELRAGPGEVVDVPDSVLGADHAAARLALEALEPKVCAEWYALDRYAEQFPEAGQDTWVFVGSDTEEGSRAAVLTALGHSYRQEGVPVRYVDDPHTADGFPLQPGGCHVVRIPGLDLSSREGLPEETWLGLGGLGGLVVRYARQLEQPSSTPLLNIVFHLSGGYKAMLPYYLTMAEAVRTTVLKKQLVLVEAFCLYEQSTNLVALPVAHFTGELLERIEKLARASRGGEVDIDPRTVNGLVGLYLYEELRGGRRGLTPAGKIIARTLWET
ncbi:hypothetical protein ABT324_09585 [Saccharopolyspora sp. NPDC000359]|uniref:hypothetical protein n=1 Tax=Saccharopolyspora sp. NPDC000359 TaxID=3154251 RepID=UPI00332C0601